MKENLKLGLILCIITSIAGLFLGLANEFTKDVIAANSKMSISDLEYILPEANDVKNLDLKLEENSSIVEAYEALADKSVIGYVLKVVSKGYVDDIEILVAIKEDKTLGGIKVLNQTESPGLGSKISEEDFQEKFKNLSISKDIVLVKGKTSNDNEVETITGATISSTAVINGVNEAINLFKEIIIK